MDGRYGRGTLASCLALVLATMTVMFTVPHQYFLAAAYVATASMILAAYLLAGFRGAFRPTLLTIAIGLATAAVLYLVFYAGNAGISAIHPFGIAQSSEGSIYSLIASSSNPLYLQVGILAFDAVGYESFFRGVLQKRMTARLGIGSVFAVAAFDALIHVSSLNPLWVATTFVADTVWGLNYYFAKDLSSNITSHFVWDLVIFLIFPIK